MDLNSDLGERFGHWTLGDDDALLDVVTSANVACGFHAGDPTTMRRTCAAAVARGVAIGAQVGYRDLAGFGRRFIDVEPAELTDDVLHQSGSLEAMARVAGSRVRYVKPHGALTRPSSPTRTRPRPWSRRCSCSTGPCPFSACRVRHGSAWRPVPGWPP